MRSFSRSRLRLRNLLCFGFQQMVVLLPFKTFTIFCMNPTVCELLGYARERFWGFFSATSSLSLLF